MMNLVKLKRTLHSLLSGAAMFAVFFVFSGVAEAAVSTTLVPYRMDASNQAAWWKPMEEFNGSVYMAYNAWGNSTAGGSADTHTVYIAKRAPNGTWTRGCLKDANGVCAVYPDDVGHNQPTIAIDGHGYIHAFASMHNNNWRYWRSSSPENVGNMVWQGRSMPDQGGQYTYPNATRSANGDVYLIIRAYPQGRLYRWNNATNTWSRVAIFANRSGYVVYPDDIIGDGSGNLHITWEWAYGGANGLRHNGSYLRYSPATNRFYTVTNAQIPVPIGNPAYVLYQPIEGTEKETDRSGPTNPPALQSAKLALGSGNRPMVAYRYRPVANGRFQVRLARWDGGNWQRQVVYGGPSDTTAAIDISTYGTGTRVYYAKAEASGAQAFSATPVGSVWTETNLLPGVPVERLSVIRRGATDHLYLAAPGAQQLYYGTSTW